MAEMDFWNASTTKKEMWVFPDSKVFPLYGLFKGIKTDVSKNGATEFYVMHIDNNGVLCKLNLGFNQKKLRLDISALALKYPKQEQALDQMVKVTCEQGIFFIAPVVEQVV